MSRSFLIALVSVLALGIGVSSAVASHLSTSSTPCVPTAGNDLFLGTQFADTCSLGAGNDQLQGKEGNDLLHGDDGADTVIGGKNNDSVYGDAGNDNVRGGDGDDPLVAGGAGDDELSGQSGNDTVFGEAGIDNIVGGIGQRHAGGRHESDSVSDTGGTGDTDILSRRRWR